MTHTVSKFFLHFSQLYKNKINNIKIIFIFSINHVACLPSLKKEHFFHFFTSRSLPLCLTVIGIRTREIAVQVRDRKLHIINRQNDSEVGGSFIQIVV